MTAAGKKEIYSPYDIASICQTGVENVLNWIQDGKIIYFQIPGGHCRVAHDSLERFLEDNRMLKPESWNGSVEKFRVLVVEDDRDLLEIIGELLKNEMRLEVRTEDNGFNAGLQIASWHPDLILLDFVMEGMNGFDVCKKLRENPETIDIPVLALTALTSPENRRAVLNCGVSDFLGKPFSSEDLLKKVRSLLGLEAVPAK